MLSRLRKTWKLWGHVGHSHMGKHQQHPGGWGHAGDMLHTGSTSTNITQVTLEKFGRRHYHVKRNQSFCPVLSLDELWTLVGEQMWVNAAKTRTGAAPIIDVIWLSYYKVLGKGKLPKQTVILKAKFFRKRAKEKIKWRRRLRCICMWGWAASW